MWHSFLHSALGRRYVIQGRNRSRNRSKHTCPWLSRHTWQSRVCATKRPRTAQLGITLFHSTQQLNRIGIDKPLERPLLRFREDATRREDAGRHRSHHQWYPPSCSCCCWRRGQSHHSHQTHPQKNCPLTASSCRAWACARPAEPCFSEFGEKHACTHAHAPCPFRTTTTKIRR